MATNFYIPLIDRFPVGGTNDQILVWNTSGAVSYSSAKVFTDGSATFTNDVRIARADESAFSVQFLGDLNENENIQNPKMQFGRLYEGGVTDKFVGRIMMSKDGVTERGVMDIEETGTIAAILDNVNRAAFEAYNQNGDSVPFVRIGNHVDTNKAGFQLGAGGATAPDVEFGRLEANAMFFALGGTKKMFLYPDACVFQPGVNFVIQNTTGLTSGIKFQEKDTAGANDYVRLLAPDVISAAFDLYLPAAQGAAGSVMLNDGSGSLSFSTALPLSMISDVTATASELNFVSGVTSAIQTQINSKASTSSLSSYVPKSGATLTGPLISSGAPTTDLELANKKYVDDNIVSSLPATGLDRQVLVQDGSGTGDGVWAPLFVDSSGNVNLNVEAKLKIHYQPGSPFSAPTFLSFGGLSSYAVTIAPPFDVPVPYGITFPGTAPTDGQVMQMVLSGGTHSFQGTWVDLPAPGITTLGDLGVTASAAELNFVDGVTSAIQTQLNAKGSVATGGTVGKIYYKSSSTDFDATWANVTIVDSGNSILLPGSARFKDSGSNYSGFKAPTTVTSSHLITTPPALPASTKLVQVDSSGVMSYFDEYDYEYAVSGTGTSSTTTHTLPTPLYLRPGDIWEIRIDSTSYAPDMGIRIKLPAAVSLTLKYTAWSTNGAGAIGNPFSGSTAVTAGSVYLSLFPASYSSTVMGSSAGLSGLIILQLTRQTPSTSNTVNMELGFVGRDSDGSLSLSTTTSDITISGLNLNPSGTGFTNVAQIDALHRNTAGGTFASFRRIRKGRVYTWE